MRILFWSLTILLTFLLSAPALSSAVQAQNQGDTLPPKGARLPAHIVETSIFANPGHFGSPRLSPDGDQVLFRQQLKGKTYLTATVLYKNDTKRIAIPENVDLRWYRWAGDGKILFSVSAVAATRFGERRHTGLYVHNIGTGETMALGRKVQGFDGDNVLFVDPAGTYLLLSMQRSVYDYPGVYRVTLSNNEISEVVPRQKRIWTWIADSEGVVRMGLSYINSTLKIYYRRSSSDKFKQIGKIGKKDDPNEALLDISHIVSGADQGFVLSNKQTGRFALYKFNYLTREVGDMVYGHDQNDITGFDLNPEGTALEAVYFTDSRDRKHWFDASFAAHQKKLNKALPGQEAWIVSKSRDGSRMIVFSTSSTDPGSYYLYEPEKKKLAWFASKNAKLDIEKLSTTEYVSYTARDGLKIHGYLTLPKHREPENLPLIILPHGGPFWVRDTLDYDNEVQFLANRGYAVLQPNFRGSDSYGEEFHKKGTGQIGRAMQDDLDDGMDWLVERGIVDPQKVCIVGASYGGYAALWGATRNPERYRCAASFAGVTDWRKQLSYDRRFLSSRYEREWKEEIRGEEDFDLDTVSPARMAEKLSRPVMLAHGKKDSIVPFSQFKIYRSALKKAGKPVKLVVYEDEGHGFSDPENEKNWLDSLESFLTEHNPAD
ncbi:Dipeptidyl aminopeptidase/acylaminoacyl peptidase [Parasphingorhabdus marina DSM 22363]|uniref:Dipeptidyl aminopeptidase/acylaminoacyl peptidase n=1 Tax=Parasphingorhabdus marina DSM 22363 TaxID=1123272 RepID=A0A1N6CM85_9SPHN|nr:S9 family peptidase [Parasphingorhabdus marina]SIN59494.1 Dipeptidyl aminopeptidase/acylaminoacyl peptidase [Parasphingorhabdus marina DSM 22363]